MLAVGRGEPSAPIVGRQAVLSSSGCWLQRARNVGKKSDSSPSKLDGFEAGFLDGSNGATRAAGASVQVVVQAPLKTVEQLLDVAHVEAGVESSPPVGFPAIF